jgi:lipoate-protein ligase A
MMNTPKLKVYLADQFDPWFNLATEKSIFRDMDADTHVLFLWRNDNTIVIGRHQNPWTECHTELMEQDGVQLARRQSGGGAVYHDLGNTNFTFMSPREHYDKNANNKIILGAMRKLGIELEASGRNDLVIMQNDGPRKVSGSAFKETKDRCFHHGTLLINANLAKLAQYLNPSKKKLESKGIKSVRSRVANLTEFNEDIDHAQIECEIIESFFDYYGAECEVERLNYDTLKDIPALDEYYQKQKDWDWRFGETPKFSHQMETRLSWGNVDVHLNCKNSVIEDAVIYTDGLHPGMIDELANSLKGIKYEQDAIAKACSDLALELSMVSDDITEFSAWIGSQIK